VRRRETHAPVCWVADFFVNIVSIALCNLLASSSALLVAVTLLFVAGRQRPLVIFDKYNYTFIRLRLLRRSFS